MKRLVDVIAGVALCVACAPLMLAVAATVRVVDGAPVLFGQARSGRGGRPFQLVKFRTMRVATGAWDPRGDDRRTTRLGRLLRRTSLDELPTLVHVVRGQMSLVGPRPLPVSYLARYDDVQARRLEVRPGITGWAQVHGRNAVEWDERLQLDVWYVDHASLAVDARILASTARLVLGGHGIDQGDGVTMSEFRGPPS